MILTLMWFASMTVVDATEKTMQGLKVAITIIVVEKKLEMHTKMLQPLHGYLSSINNLS